MTTGQQVCGWLLVFVILGSAVDAGAGQSLEADPGLQAPIPQSPDGLLVRPVAPFRIPYDRVKERKLANGLTLVMVEDLSVPLVDIAIAVKVGSRLEDAGLDQRACCAADAPPPGAMSMTALLLKAGGTQTMDPETLDALSEFRGVKIRSFGGRHRSGVVASAASADFEVLSQWAAEVLMHPRFDSAQTVRYRDNALRSLASRYDSPLSVAQREWEALVLGRDHPRFRPLRREDIEKWSSETFSRVHQRYYRPEDTVVAIAGGVAEDRALDRFEALFGGWQSPAPDPSAKEPSVGELSVEDRAVEDRAVEDRAGEGRTISPAAPGFYQVLREVQQGTLILGQLGTQRGSWFDAEADAAEMLSEILGGPGPVSRLRGRLRDRDGVVYSVRGGVAMGASEPGLVQVVWQVDADSGLAALVAAMEEIARLQQQAVSREELDLARGALVDSLPTLFDSAEEIAGRYAEDVLLGRPHEFWQRYASRLAVVTPEQVRRAAQKFLRPGDLRAVWVGPKLPERPIRRLGFSKVKVLPRRDPTTLVPIAPQAPSIRR